MRRGTAQVTAAIAGALLLLCDASADGTDRPADVVIGTDAGAWNQLFVNVRIGGPNGRQFAMGIDTGSPVTLLDKSFANALGRPLETGPADFDNFGRTLKCRRYAAPALYLGAAQLVTAKDVFAGDLTKLAMPSGRPIAGILGMDCLRHYFVQLDFVARRMRFLDPEYINPTGLGTAYRMTLSPIGQSEPDWVRAVIQHAGLTGGPVGDCLVDTGDDSDGGVKAVTGRDAAGVTRLKSCTWDGRTYRDVAIHGNAEMQSIGLRFLARHLVTFDFPHGVLYLKPIRAGPLEDEDLNGAMGALAGMKRSTGLPGWPKEEAGNLDLEGRLDADTYDFAHAGKTGTDHYRMSRLGAKGSWELRRAWHTNGDRVTEYPIP